MTATAARVIELRPAPTRASELAVLDKLTVTELEVIFYAAGIPAGTGQDKSLDRLAQVVTETANRLGRATISAIVEKVQQSRHTPGGWRLAREIWQDPQRRDDAWWWAGYFHHTWHHRNDALTVWQQAVAS